MHGRFLYDLAAADDDRRFSPYCWRTKLALAHKGLDYETLPWRFTEKDKLAFAGVERVPVLTDGDRVVADSWSIACDLEARYPATPSLFGDERGRSLAGFVNNWADAKLGPPLLRVLAMDIFRHVHAKDRDYFRASREQRLGKRLEDIELEREMHLSDFRAQLAPINLALRREPFLSGGAPAYADYVVMGTFMWARTISPIALVTAGEAIYDWRERMLGLFGGLCRRAPGYADDQAAGITIV